MATQLIITLTDEGSLQVGGPIQNKLLCYGMLEMARQAVAEFKQQDAQLIQPVPAGSALPADFFKV